MIIIDAKFEPIVQVDDMFRIDCSMTKYADGETINKIEVDMEGGGVYQVMPEGYLDYAFETAGEKTISIKATSGAESKTVTKTIEVITEAEDKLFSGDQDLLLHEEAIHELLRPGKRTFKNVHRLAQQEILRDLKERFPDEDLSKTSLVEIDQVKAWSKYLTLHYIFESNVRSVDDIHVEKSQTYKSLAEVARKNVPLKLDTDGDGKEDLRTTFSSLRLTL